MDSRAYAPPAIAPADGHPFDAVAADYDATFSDTRLGRWYRGMVREHISRFVQAGDHVLELGCGTGEDAVWLARRGVRVTATDAAPHMLEIAASKARARDVERLVEFQPLDLNSLDGSHSSALDGPGDGPALWDAVLANFGPLNCVADRRELSGYLASAVRPGGHVFLTVMGPLCPWEMFWHGARLEFRTAFRRLRSGTVARMGPGGTLPVWYPSAGRLESEFRPWFDKVDLLGLGLLLPPTGMARLVERAPRLFSPLAVLDQRAARLAPWRWLNDHYLLVMERRAA